MQLLARLRLALRRLRSAPLFTAFAAASLVLVIGVSTAVYSTVQGLFSEPPGVPRPQELRPLPAQLRTHLQNERMDAVTSIRGLPLGVRDGLQTLFGSQTLEIADPREEFQAAGAVARPPLPIRRLVAAGCSIESLPRLLRARRLRAQVAGRALPLGAVGDAVRVGRFRSGRHEDHRRGSQVGAFWSDRSPE